MYPEPNDLSCAGPSNFPSLPSSSGLLCYARSRSHVVAGENDELDSEGSEQQHMMSSTDAIVANQTLINSAIGEVRVFVNPDVLDCSLCMEPLSLPMLQCENGHITCCSCCSKVNGKCPSCSMPTSYKPCKAFEKVMESAKVLCKNAQNGCEITTLYSKKNEHEQMCPHATCYCPHPSCPFEGSSENMYLHFGIQHASSTTRFTYDTTFFVHVKAYQKHIFLQEQHESVVFILNHEVKERGQRALSVECVGPGTLKYDFEYHITASEMGSTLCLQSVPEVYTQWFEHPPRKLYLTIPAEFFTCMETLHIELCIKKHGAIQT